MRLMLYLFTVALLIIGSTSTLNTHANVQDDGLILYFSFDDAKNGTVMDETGGGNDGVIDGAEIATKDSLSSKN